MQEEQTLIEAKELGLKKFRKSPFWNVSLKVKPHEIVAISGEHGSGKSALLLALSGYMNLRTELLQLRMQLFLTILKNHVNMWDWDYSTELTNSTTLKQ